MTNSWIAACVGGALLAAVPCDGRPVKPSPEPGRYMRAAEDPGRSMSLEIAARTFAPAAGAGEGPTVSLVGVAHIGERGLYDTLQTLLDEHDVVLYESVKPPGTGGAGGDDDEERIDSSRAAMHFLAAVLSVYRDASQRYPQGLDELAAYAGRRDPRLKDWLAAVRVDAWGGEVEYRVEGDGSGFVLTSLGADRGPGGEGANADLVVTSRTPVEAALAAEGDDNLQAELARALGLEFQLEAIDYDRRHFRNSDMSMDQIERAFEEHGLDFAPIEGSLAGSSLLGRFAVIALRLVRLFDVFLDGAIADAFKVILIEVFSDEAFMEQSLKQFGDGFEDVIIDQRNQVVVDDLRTILEQEGDVGSVAIFYGAAHMPDLGQRLIEQLGYEPTGERWYTAFEVDLANSSLTPQRLRSIRMMVRQQLRMMGSERD